MPGCTEKASGRSAAAGKINFCETKPTGDRGRSRRVVQELCSRPSDPASVERYLEAKFGDRLDEARTAMMRLARALPPPRLASGAYALYEEFRPRIPAGVRGWGAAGDLDLDRIEALAG